MSRIYYDTDPGQFVAGKFSLYENYWRDVLEPECTDNWKMFLGWDEYIRRRAMEKRSSLQSHMLFPAVEGRTSVILARLRSREPLLRYEPADRKDPFQVLNALKLQEWVRNVLERQNWLEKIAMMIMASEIWPISWVKTRLGEMEMTPSEQHHLSELYGIPPRALIGQKRSVPEFEVLPPYAVFYDYRVKDRNDRRMEKFHVKPISLSEVHDRYGSDVVRKIEDHDSAAPTWEQEWEQAQGRKAWREHGEPRYRLAEGWINAHYKDGRIERRMIHFFPDAMLGEGGDQPNGLVVSDDPAPVSFDPFIAVVARPLPGELMGRATVGIGKSLQREDAELTNMGLDILGYTAAPPIILDKQSVDDPSQLKFAARSLWLLNDTSFVPRPLHVPLPNAPFMESMRRELGQKLNHVTAAQEGVTGQQGPGKQRETLGEFRHRNQGGLGRLDIPYLGYAGAIRGIGERYWFYIREFPRMILGRTPLPIQTPLGQLFLTTNELNVDAMVRVPNLTEFENDEMKKIELDRFMERIMPMPIIAGNPIAQQVLASIYAKRNIFDPDDLQQLLMSFLQPLDPNLLAQGNGGGGPQQSLPRTNFMPGIGNSERGGGFISAAQAGGG